MGIWGAHEPGAELRVTSGMCRAQPGTLWGSQNLLSQLVGPGSLPQCSPLTSLKRLPPPHPKNRKEKEKKKSKNNPRMKQKTQNP